MTSLLNYALAINVYVLLSSLLPVRRFFGEIQGMETDGLKIIKAIRRTREF